MKKIIAPFLKANQHYNVTIPNHWVIEDLLVFHNGKLTQDFIISKPGTLSLVSNADDTLLRKTFETAEEVIVVNVSA